MGNLFGQDLRVQRGGHHEIFQRGHEWYSLIQLQIVAVEMPKLGDDESTTRIRRIIDPLSFSNK